MNFNTYYLSSQTKNKCTNCCNKKTCCPKYSNPVTPTRGDADYIIIGAGTAGLTAAWALSNPQQGKPLNSVLVIEAGEEHKNDPNVLNPTMSSSQQLTLNPKYARTIITLKEELYSDGRCIGGSSAHNGLQAVRGTQDVYNEWAELTGKDHWLYENLLPLFIDQENYTPTGTFMNNFQRGSNGRLFITQDSPLTDKFSEALARALGVDLIHDYNSHAQIAPGIYENTVGVSANQNYITPPPNSIRSYSGNSYLYGIPGYVNPIINNNGTSIGHRKLKVLPSLTVSKIIFEGRKAVGVEVITSGNKRKIYYARKGVILSAGTIGSAAILQLSGIGDSNLLNPLGIKVVYENKNVGMNVQNHYGPSALVKLIDENSPPPSDSLNVGFASLGQLTMNRDVQVDFMYPGSKYFNRATLNNLGIGNENSVSVGGILLRSSSRGSIKIQNSDPLTPPLLDLGNYTDTNHPQPWTVSGSDAAKAITYLKIVQKIAQEQGGDNNDVLFPPPDAYESDEKLFNVARTNVFNTYHCVGSCRMAKTPSEGVVDGNLQVFGVQNLWIADCSIEPIIQTGNTAYSAYFIGLVLAKILGADLP